METATQEKIERKPRGICRTYELWPHQIEHLRAKRFITHRSELDLVRELIDRDIENFQVKIEVVPKNTKIQRSNENV
jgi:hypothetical protein